MSNPDITTFPQLLERLRRSPRHTVDGSLAVLFFGDVFAARIATVGINPSDQEYLSRNSCELTGDARRFETLTSLGAASRSSLTDGQCAAATRTMQAYFDPGKPIYGWFRSLDHVTQAMGYGYAAGQVAHLDLIQEATKPTWSALARAFPDEAAALLAADLPFLRWQLTTLPLRAVLCNGMTVLQYVCSMLDHPVDVDKRALGRLARVTWYAIQGHIGGRELIIAGWNIPLARLTGLGRQGETVLGQAVKSALDMLGTPGSFRA